MANGPRGLKTLLKRTAPAALRGRGGRRAFVDAARRRLRGLTKRLETCLWSEGAFPSSAFGSHARRGGAWRGSNGGRRRGTAVDAQLTRVVNRGSTSARGQFVLTRYVLAALDLHGLDPVVAQRAVADASRRLATAADLICVERASGRLAVVELKCGHSGDRSAAATSNGRACRLRAPFDDVPDTTLNRHFAQLAATRALFARERTTLARARALGVSPGVSAALLYADDEGVTRYELPACWRRRQSLLLDALGR
jgi:hypothetical protein